MSDNNEGIKLHLGCGNRKIPGFVHVDSNPSIKGLDYVASIHKLGMFQNNSCDLIYCSHTLEYYSWQEAKDKVLPEFNRVLKPGGILRLAVPNFTAICSLYTQGKYDLQAFIGPLYGRMLADSKYIYHRCVYDQVILSKLLEKTGFCNVHKWDWQEVEHKDIDDYSRSYLPHLDFVHGTLISLNLEATKNGE